ncbi:MAG: HPr family phosphocarrier protein [Planctomycetes bacterium]|nr:HPr family phosphocarrier protein [Planctomycetota bacterium]
MHSALTVQIVNPEGLHARPCHAIVSLALEYDCSLAVQCGEAVADGRSILSLMTLQACQGSELAFTAEGQGAEELLERLRALVSGGF